jgi:MHS family proline/betaine transporter-like MFS transporter
MHVARKDLRLIVGASLIGNALEWYEFYFYVHFSPIFALLFFPNFSAEGALAATFSVFAFGFLSRPFGTIFFGHIGDRFGRRIALISSIALMAFPTVCIGLLPTYAQIGLTAAFLMAMMRFLQGFSIGGEYTGAICYLIEFAPPHKRGIMGSWASFGAEIGSIVSISEFILLETFSTQQHITGWGWRITFIVGGFIGLAGWYLRKKLKETPAFITLRKEGRITPLPIVETFKNYKIPMLKAMALTAFPLTGWYLVFVFTPVYSAQILERNLIVQMLILLGSLVISTLSLPLFGMLADKGYTRWLWILGSLGGILLAYPLFIPHDSLALEISLRALAAIFFSIQYALQPMLMCALFPTQVRYTAVGVSYNFYSIFLGGGAPILTLILTRITDNYLVPVFLMVGTALLSACVLLVIKNKDPDTR